MDRVVTVVVLGMLGACAAADPTLPAEPGALLGR